MIRNPRMINPVVLLASLMLVLIITQAVFVDTFGGIDFNSIAIIVFYVSLFAFGFYITILFWENNRRVRVRRVNCVLVKRRYADFFISACLLYLLFLFGSYIVAFGISGMTEYRTSLINEYRGDRGGLYWITRAFSLFFFYSLMSFIFNKDDKKRMKWLYLAMIFAIIGSGRNYILILFISFASVLIRDNRLTKRLIVFWALVFFGINALYVYFFNKAPDYNIVVGALHSIMAYLTYPIHSLSEILEQGHIYGSSQMLSDGTLNFLGIMFEPQVARPYASYPYQTNVYTLFYSLQYDLGIVFGSFMGFVFGSAHGYLYVRAKNNDLYYYYYCVSLYALLMTPFDNVYTTSFGLWLAVIIPSILFKKNFLIQQNELIVVK